MWKNFNPTPFLKNNIINVPIQKGRRWYGLLTAEETSCNNASINYFNDSFDNIILDAEDSAGVIIFISIIESNFANDHTQWGIQKSLFVWQ